jgi:hypothetical protein
MAREATDELQGSAGVQLDWPSSSLNSPCGQSSQLEALEFLENFPAGHLSWPVAPSPGTGVSVFQTVGRGYISESVRTVKFS